MFRNLLLGGIAVVFVGLGIVTVTASSNRIQERVQEQVLNRVVDAGILNASVSTNGRDSVVSGIARDEDMQREAQLAGTKFWGTNGKVKMDLVVDEDVYEAAKATVVMASEEDASAAPAQVEVEETSAKDEEGGGLVSGLVSMADDAAKAVEDTVENTVEATGELVEGTVEVVSDVAEGTAEVAGDMVEGTVEVVSDVAEGTAEVAGDMVEGTAEVVTDVAEGTAQVAGDMVEGTVEVVSDVAEGTAEVAGDMAEGTVEVVGDVAEGTVDVAGAVVDGTVEVASDLVGGAVALVAGTEDESVDTSTSVTAETAQSVVVVQDEGEAAAHSDADTETATEMSGDNDETSNASGSSEAESAGVLTRTQALQNVEWAIVERDTAANALDFAEEQQVEIEQALALAQETETDAAARVESASSDALKSAAQLFLGGAMQSREALEGELLNAQSNVEMRTVALAVAEQGILDAEAVVSTAQAEEGDTRTNDETGMAESYSYGAWYPVYAFEASKDECAARVAALQTAEKRITFASGATDLDADAASIAGEIASLVRHCEQSASFIVEIGGHTDSQGDEEANRALSQARADAVRDTLIELGLSPTRTFAVGFGEVLAIADNETEEGRAANRRIEFTFR